jgi:signal transduction histidine kinase
MPTRSLGEQLHVLSGALRAFAEATANYERLLDVVARTLADGMSDGCVVQLLTSDGELAHAASYFSLDPSLYDGEASARVHAHVAALHDLADRPMAQYLLEAGEPILMARLDLGDFSSTAAPEALQTYRALGIHSLLLVALRVSGKSVGVLSLFRFAPTLRPFDVQDLEMAQALADHAALAISNSLLLRSAVEELDRRKSAEQAQVKAVEQVRHADRLATVGKLIAGVAHELGSPLNVIGGHAQLIAGREVEGDELVQSALTIFGQVGRATAIVRQLLDFARRDDADADISVDALAVAQSVVGLLKSFARKTGVSLRVLGEPVRVQAGEESLGQVFTNLLMNAVHASSAGSEVTIAPECLFTSKPGTAAQRAYARIDIRDAGTGMSDTIRAQIFEPFFTTKARGDGTGLGLSVVQGIVQEHHGWIAVSTLPQHGTTFSVFLPVAPPSDAQLPCGSCGRATADRASCGGKSQ